MSTWKRNFLILWAGQFVAVAGLTVMVPLLPFYIEELTGKDDPAKYWWTGLCLAAPAMTSIIFSPIWGRLGDDWGRKWMAVRALTGLAISLGLMGGCQSPWQLLWCRLLQGAFGGVVDAAAAFAGSQAPPEKKGSALGRLQSATAAGSFLGPLLGGILADICGFRFLFAMMALLTAFSSFLAMWKLSETPHLHGGKGGGIQRRRMTEEWMSLFQDKETRAFILAGVCAQAGIYGVTVVFAPYVVSLAKGQEHSAAWVGVLQALTWLSAMLTSPWWGKQNDSKPVRINFFWAALGCGISIWLQALISSVTWLIPLRIMQGMCFAALIPSVFYQVSRCTDHRNQSAKIGLANSCLVGGQIKGSLLASVFHHCFPLHVVMIAMGSLFLLGAYLVFTSSDHVKAERYSAASRSAE